MKIRTLAFVAMTLTGLSGCPVTQLNRLPTSSPLLQPAPISAAGEYRHSPSGYVFPTQVGGFRRVDLVQYDKEGLDVSAGYNDSIPECLIALTIYVYPTPRMTFIGASPDAVRSLEAQWLEGGYNLAKQEIARAHSDAELESEDAKTQDGVPGKKAIYAIGENQSELYIFVVWHAWFLKYRATYPRNCAGQAQTAMHSFFSTWVGRAS